MDSNINRAIIKTLIYHDLFDYPLMAIELWRFLIWEAEELPDKKEFSDALTLKNGFCEKRGYYFLPGRGNIILKRISRHYESKAKNFQAQKVATFLKIIPTIQFLGVSGSLSMNNSRAQDDIDLFIVTKKNTLWITRFFVGIAVLLSGRKRNFKEKEVKDKICLNMFVSEDNLSFNQNLYIAHEIAQLKTLINRNNTYEKLLLNNGWVNNFLPNIIVDLSSQKKEKNLFSFFEKLIYFVDFAFFAVQYLYMKSKITTERIERGRAQFHPRDHSSHIISFYRERCSLLIRDVGLDVSKLIRNNKISGDLN